MQEPLFIAAGINGAYVLPLKVMLASLKEYLASTYRPVLYLLNRSLSPEQLESISLLVETHSIVPSDDQTKMLARQRGFPTEAAFPLLLPDLLPESVERVLFLDADILVLDDVAKIWEADISGSSVAAVADQAIPICSSPRGVKNRSALGIPDAAPYFNAGVMVLNLARWRRLGVASRAHEYLRQLDGQADFLHQEALNAVLWNDWLPLDQRWNLVASLTGRRYGPHRRTTWTPPGIVHFSGRLKPWRMHVGGPFAAAYDQYLARCSAGAFRRNRSLAEKVASLYDRNLRDYFYSCERALWNRRMI